MGKQTADAPDYLGAAKETAKSDAETLATQTQANRPTQITPFGEVHWTQDPQGNWTQTTSLSGDQQAALDDQMGIQKDKSELASSMFDRSSDEFGKPMDWSQFGEYSKMGGDPDAARKTASDAMYGRATSRLDPQFAQQQDAMVAQLRNQGLKPGDKAYDTAMQNFQQGKNDAYTQAQYQADIGGGAEAERTQNMGAASAGFNNTVRQSQISEEMQKRGFSLNEINAILNGQQVALPTAPGFTNAGKSQAVDYSGAASAQYGAAQDAANVHNQMMQNLGNMASSAASFSDERLKENIQYLFTRKGRKFYVWDWVFGGSGFGVLAQENMDIAFKHSSGYLMVDYGRIS